MADRDWLRLEVRYNYEGQDTASIRGGYNFASKDNEMWEVMPMLSGVFGDTRGVAAGGVAAHAARWWRVPEIEHR